jgi:Cro/C1-type helix-turn-helix DNA-binding protein
MGIRFRFPELLTEHDTTAYALAKRSGGRLDASTLYRLVRSKGRVRFIDAELLEALADTLGVRSMDELLGRDNTRRRQR